jgi:hypothetical protein
MNSNYKNGHSGHAKGHVRDAFLNAIEEFLRWTGESPEPTVEFEDRTITISAACGMLWNCTDVLPHASRDALSDYGRQSSYAVAARCIKRAIAQIG